MIAALLAKIHTVEWTPAVISHPTTVTALRANWFGLAGERLKNAFGRISSSEVISGIPGAATEHYGVPFSLTEEFAAVYRMHPLVPDDFELPRSWPTTSPLGDYTLPRPRPGPTASRCSASTPSPTCSTPSAPCTPALVSLHNFPRFLQDFVRPDGKLMDLAATDILRIRELGVPRYCEFRRLLHLTPPATFDELTDDREDARRDAPSSTTATSSSST